MKKFFLRLFIFFVILGAVGAVVSGLFVYGAFLYFEPKLPPISALKEIKLTVPLRVKTADNKLMSEFGVEKRILVNIDDVPDYMNLAIISAEDDRFWTHPGVDIFGLIRAAFYLIKTGKKGQGGSTITMQVARNYLLTREKTYLRKFNEIFLSLKIEKELSKRKILELYYNKIFLGHRSYGIAAAAQTYYGKSINELSLTQLAMIAGLPKAPSQYNPIVNPARALERRNYVLKRMYKLKHIDIKTYRKALATPDDARLYAQKNEVDAPYVSEMVRDRLVKKYGKQIYKLGYQVQTTLDSKMQIAANKAVRRALLDYDLRHGYRGPIAHFDLSPESDQETWTSVLAKYDRAAGFLPALVLIAGDKQYAKVFEVRHGIIDIPWDGLQWAKLYINNESQGAEPKIASEVLKVGDVIYIERVETIVKQKPENKKQLKAIDEQQIKQYWRLAQIPEVQGALVALDPKNGQIKALVGGFDFNLEKFNRVTQALRQPGSNFKPFIYSSSLEKGFTPASIINDAPVVFADSSLEDEWRPENYSGQFFGPTRLRKALVKSRNLVSIRLLRAIGVKYAINFVQRFGFKSKDMPRNLSLALGTVATTPLSIARGYSTFANGGYLVDPYYISQVAEPDGTILELAPQIQLCDTCDNQENGSMIPTANKSDITVAHPLLNGDSPKADSAMVVEREIKQVPRVLSRENVYIMTTILRDVVRQGTGRKALRLGRHDLAGKTGTTNDQKDAWFSGFNDQIVGTVWLGFDTPRPLGRRETGAGAALPMWIYFMEKALKGMPENPMHQPPNLITVRIDPETGKLAAPGDPDAIFETFRKEFVPTSEETVGVNADNQQNPDATNSRDLPELF